VTDELRAQLERTLSGSYHLESELSGGGMSRVFLAMDTALGRKVVVKVLPPELAATVNVERFQREIQLAARLQHPHIVPLLSAGVTDELPYYTMPLVEGETLKAKLSRQGELPVSEVLRIVRDVASALVCAHESGVVHRDIKPGNVLVSKHGAVVTDFGVAKAVSASASSEAITLVGIALGTPAYMPPEQAAGDPATDHRADIYALGAVAYEMLTGRQVFSARSPQAMLHAHSVETPEPVESHRPAVPPRLSGLVMQMLEKHAADRPQTAEELLRTIEDLIAAPSGGTQATAGLRTRRASAVRARRATLLAIAAAVLLVSMLAGRYLMGRYGGSSSVLPRIAVLPFENGGAPDDAYFAEGMSEAIGNRLSTLSGLVVIGRQSARQSPDTSLQVVDIARRLDVDFVLTGSVRWDKSTPGQSRVSVRPALFRADDGAQVWSQSYDALLSGVFEMQAEVAERVAQALDVTFASLEEESLRLPPTSNTAAYDAYLRGRALWSTRTFSGLRGAIDAYEEAIRLDPGYARAHQGLAETFVLLPEYAVRPGSSARLEAQRHAQQAILFDSSLAGPHAVLGLIGMQEFRFDDAERHFQRALAVDRGYSTTYHWYSRLLTALGREREAVASAMRARELEPLSGIIAANLSQQYLIAGDYARAERAALAAQELDVNRLLGRFQRAEALTMMGRYDQALAVADTARRIAERVGHEIPCDAASAAALFHLGRSDAAGAELRRCIERPTDREAMIAWIYAQRGQPDSAIMWARRARDPLGLRFPFLAPIRNHPEFTALLKELGMQR
jgi:TolB-like protein/tRNA A-37 threonylcarbamoyl transferase component Bud32/Flp pilus assembly protein TadD